MAKSLVFGNGRLHVGLDNHGFVSDLYFPYVGLENHLSPGLSHKFGVYVDGHLSWLDDKGWTTASSYHHATMIGETIVTHATLGLRIEFTDAVDQKTDMFVRSIHVVNTTGDARTVSVYCYQAFMIGGSTASDTVQYRPDLPGVVHYKGDRVFLATLQSGTTWFDDFSTGRFDVAASSGTFRDAEDGHLERNAVENGRVDSTLGMQLALDPYDSKRVSYVLIATRSVEAAEALFAEFAENTSTPYLARTAASWYAWTQEARLPATLSEAQRRYIYDSLVIIAAHIDSHGAVMASLDSELRNHPQDDAYNFCWPRDAVYALWPLLRLGYTRELLSFFDFAVRGVHDDGYMQHKYRADGSLGSTWLPYEHPDGSVHPPIQSDETAAVLFLAGQFYRHTAEQAFLSRYYETLVEPMANFLAGYTDTDGLPLPSYDLWEHNFSTSTYTTALTYAALLEAVELADVYGRTTDSARWRAAAETIQTAAACLYNPTTQYFYRGFTTAQNGEKQFDERIDSSSLYGAFMFGLYNIDSDTMTAAIATAQTVLQRNNLYARFVGDSYYGNSTTPNLWPVVSLWMAEIALERDDVGAADSIIAAVLALRSSGGMLPEQVDPETFAATSLSPLVWSHAELISALIDYSQVQRS